MHKKLAIFETSLEKIARTLSDKWNVNIVFSQDMCCTDGRTIYLPSIPTDATKELLNAMQGHLDHEVAHVVFSDFDVVNKHFKDAQLRITINCLEDVRIEHKWMQLYPGARINLKNSSNWAANKVLAENEKNDNNEPIWSLLSPYRKLLFVLTMNANNKFVPFSEDWFLQHINDTALEAEAIKHVDIFLKARDALNTEAIVPLAKELMERLKNHEDYENENENENKMVTIRVPDANKDVNDLIFTQYNEDDEKLLDKYEQLRYEFSKYNSNDSYSVYSTEGDSVEKIRKGNSIAYRNFLKQIAPILMPMRQRLARVLLATNQSRWEADKKRGKINVKKLHRLFNSSDKRVFRQKRNNPGYDTCVLLMIDHSASMNRRPLIVAQQTTIVLSEVLYQIGIPFGIYGFSTGDASISNSRRIDAGTDRYSRYGNLWLGAYKSFDEFWPSKASSVMSMESNSKYNTYDGESLRYGARILLERPEKRKVLFWLNDGEPYPNYGENQKDHYEYAKKIAKETEKVVELIAFGILTSEVEHIYSNCVVVNNLEDLPKSCLLKLSALLRKEQNGIIKQP